MRNFRGGYKNDSSNFSRSDRRPVRDSRYGNDDYKRPDKVGVQIGFPRRHLTLNRFDFPDFQTFNSGFPDRNTKPRRDFDSDHPRSSFGHQVNILTTTECRQSFQQKPEKILLKTEIFLIHVNPHQPNTFKQKTFFKCYVTKSVKIAPKRDLRTH